ncbi:MAG TPA: cupin domain-containing protein [Pyrinomonadaceae bacterium]|nr:cupin domain-containing protein [Pyrinomonadaceae bacterium]
MKIVSLADVPEEGVSHNPEIRKRVLIRRGELPRLISFSRAVLKPGQAAAAHSHADIFEVFFVEAGAGTIRAGGAEARLEAGACVTVGPGEEHEIINTGTSELVLVYFGLEAGR